MGPTPTKFISIITKSGPTCFALHIYIGAWQATTSQAFEFQDHYFSKLSILTMTRIVLLIPLLCILCVFPASSAETKDKTKLQTYIVHVKKPNAIDSFQSEELHNWYQSFLPTSTEENSYKIRRSPNRHGQ